MLLDVTMLYEHPASEQRRERCRVDNRDQITEQDYRVAAEFGKRNEADEGPDNDNVADQTQDSRHHTRMGACKFSDVFGNRHMRFITAEDEWFYGKFEA